MVRHFKEIYGPLKVISGFSFPLEPSWVEVQGQVFLYVLLVHSRNIKERGERAVTREKGLRSLEADFLPLWLLPRRGSLEKTSLKKSRSFTVDFRLVELE